MSIQMRLNIAIGLLLVIALAGMIAAVRLDAGPRMRAENESIMRLTETIVRSSVTTLQHSDEPKARLTELVASLKNLRHVSVSLASTMSAGLNSKYNVPDSGGWWHAKDDVVSKPLRIPVEVSNGLLDTIIITPQPDDEMMELEEAVSRIFQVGVILGLCVLALTSLVINRSLRSIQSLNLAMHHLEDGDYAVTVKEAGPPEIRTISSGLNRLASALRKSRAENQRLTTTMIHVQDDERRSIARDLHDELGPYLFSLRTSASFLKRELEKSPPDHEKSQRLTGDMLSWVDQLQRTNRRVLHRLTPIGLAELGLKGALSANVAMWRRDHTETNLDFQIVGDIDALDETLQLTVYRVAQEGLTNAYRHSGASQISLSIAFDRSDAEKANVDGDRDPQHSNTTLTIVIRDNGSGFKANTQDGFGLTSMRQRISALGGQLTIETAPGAGTQLTAIFPGAVVANAQKLTETADAKTNDLSQAISVS
ncbi:MAG: hypothetical protein CTY31_09010 [Hyphomicrobium sp.]|nr:MAG: hypothetical protein CTY31_09010 [Hyphomicrobium sp.]